MFGSRGLLALPGSVRGGLNEKPRPRAFGRDDRPGPALASAGGGGVQSAASLGRDETGPPGEKHPRPGDVERGEAMNGPTATVG